MEKFRRIYHRLQWPIAEPNKLPIPDFRREIYKDKVYEKTGFREKETTV